MKTNKKKSSTMRKLLPAVAMLAVSAVSLSSATYAWFTMNKSVEVTGMKLKAQAEKGLLINEMAGTGSVGDPAVANGTYAESATAGQDSAIALRPTSTKDLTDWWHANSKKSSEEAGANAAGSALDTDNTVVVNGKAYSSVKYTEGGTVAKSETAAVADTNAKRTVFYTDGTGDNNGYDNGEGYYVEYVYYLKSSSNATMNVTADKLTAEVTAALPEGATAQALDPALRVGVKIDNVFQIFAPVSGADASYYVTGTDAGGSYTQVQPTTSGAAAMGTSSTTIAIPAVTENGLPVYVYVWFEGEDTHCKSDNIAADLNSYEITVKFVDTEL